ncbi:MAG: DUF4912 domain-containing protein, partial [Nitrospinae bacterium]|nr:DUF4912 domain-containing protein [Nitrospinota bacterium]
MIRTEEGTEHYYYFGVEMTKAELNKQTVKELQDLAKKKKIDISGKKLKGEIIDVLVKEFKKQTTASKKPEKTVKAKVSQAVTKKEGKPKTKTIAKNAEKTAPEKSAKGKAKPVTKGAPTKSSAPKKTNAVKPKAKTIKEKTKIVTVVKQPENDPLKLSTNGRRKNKFEEIDQSIVEQSAKFYLAKNEPLHKKDINSFIPESYEGNNLRLIIRDPNTLFVYWNISDGAYADAKGSLALQDGIIAVLRIVRVDTGSFYEVEIPEGAKSQYLEVLERDCPIKVLLGLKNKNNEFVIVRESNSVYVASCQPNVEGIDERGAKIFALSLGVSDDEFLEMMQTKTITSFRVGSEEFIAVSEEML